MNNPERIHIEVESDWWTCLCGNDPRRTGFETCAETGFVMEPDIDSDWPGLYICIECGRIINSDGFVVRRVPEEELEPIVNDLLKQIESL